MYLFDLQFCLDICPGMGLLDHMATLFLSLLATSILFSSVAALIYIPTTSVERLPLLHTLWYEHFIVLVLPLKASQISALPKGMIEIKFLILLILLKSYQKWFLMS